MTKIGAQCQLGDYTLDRFTIKPYCALTSQPLTTVVTRRSFKTSPFLGQTLLSHKVRFTPSFFSETSQSCLTFAQIIFLYEQAQNHRLKSMFATLATTAFLVSAIVVLVHPTFSVLYECIDPMFQSHRPQPYHARTQCCFQRRLAMHHQLECRLEWHVEDYEHTAYDRR